MAIFFFMMQIKVYSNCVYKVENLDLKMDILLQMYD